MPVSGREELWRRRFGAALALSLGLHGLLALMPVSPLRSGARGSEDGTGGPGLLGQFLAAALQGADVTLSPPEPLPGQQITTEVVAEPGPGPPPAPSAEITVDPEATEAVDSAAGAGPAAADEAVAGSAGVSGPTGDPAGGAGAEGLPGPPPEVAIRPRELVQPRVPAEIIRKRKIDDYVLLQVLVGTDGSVRQVRVLRAIPNCQECTASAVDAARGYRYNPVLVAGRLAEVWTVPFPLHFR